MYVLRMLLAAIALALVSPATHSQTFIKVDDPSNPILNDISSGYSGAAWVDVNGDSALDLFVNNSFLYRGDGNGGFTEAMTAIGLGISLATGNGTSWGDFDNDGDLDVYIASGSSFLYAKAGNGSFAQVVGGEIGMGFANRGWSQAWADFNNDGYLDLAVNPVR